MVVLKANLRITLVLLRLLRILENDDDDDYL